MNLLPKGVRKKAKGRKGERNRDRETKRKG